MQYLNESKNTIDRLGQVFSKIALGSLALAIVFFIILLIIPTNKHALILLVVLCIILFSLLGLTSGFALVILGFIRALRNNIRNTPR